MFVSHIELVVEHPGMRRMMFAAATLFIGTVQGLAMQSPLAGDGGRIHRDAPRVFAIYQRGVRNTQ